jgi:hypothetical protein
MAKVPECIGGPRKHLVKPARSIVANARAQQLKTAKQILAEVFHTRLCDVEDMIMRRLVEKDRVEENAHHANWGTWPEMFWVEDVIKS